MYISLHINIEPNCNYPYFIFLLQNDLSDFDYYLKTFSCFVPALTQLELQLYCNQTMFKKLRFETLFYSNTKIAFKSYFKILKRLVLMYRYT